MYSKCTHKMLALIKVAKIKEPQNVFVLQYHQDMLHLALTHPLKYMMFSVANISAKPLNWATFEKLGASVC